MCIRVRRCPLVPRVPTAGHCHIPYSGPHFPSLLSPSFPLHMLYFSRISPTTSVHHPTCYPAFRILQPACTPDLRTFGSPDLRNLSEYIRTIFPRFGSRLPDLYRILSDV